MLKSMNKIEFPTSIIKKMKPFNPLKKITSAIADVISNEISKIEEGRSLHPENLQHGSYAEGFVKEAQRAVLHIRKGENIRFIEAMLNAAKREMGAIYQNYTTMEAVYADSAFSVKSGGIDALSWVIQIYYKSIEGVTIDVCKQERDALLRGPHTEVLTAMIEIFSEVIRGDGGNAKKALF